MEKSRNNDSKAIISNLNNDNNNRHIVKNKKINNINKPLGLFNLGLTCYMNSLLQCFYYIIELREYLINNSDKFNNEKIVTKELSNVMYELKYNENKYFKPIEFKKLIGKKNKLFEGRKAADVKDLFFNLIDCLTNELNNNDSEESSILSEEIDFSQKEEVYKITEKEFYDSNFINQLFLGFYEIEYLCPVKHNGEKKYIYTFQIESFMLFELENIKNYYLKEDLSLDLCFRYFTKTEKNSSFYCSLCKVNHCADAKNKIYKPPKILVIILDRGKGKKFVGKVKYEKYLDLKDYIDEDSYCTNTFYKLICISKHSGESSENGHYTAYCLNDNGKYYHFNDSYVEKVTNEDELYKGDAYLLFYKKVDIDNSKLKEEINEESDIEKLKNNFTQKIIDNKWNLNRINNEKENGDKFISLIFKNSIQKKDKNTNNIIIRQFKFFYRSFEKWYKYLILYIFIFILSIMFYEFFFEFI